MNGPMSGWHTAGPYVAKAMIGKTLDEAKLYAEKNAFELVAGKDVPNKDFKANRIQYKLKHGKIVEVTHG